MALQQVAWYGLPTNISASALVYTGPGTVVGVVVNSHTNGTLKLWDSLTATGTVLNNTITFAAGSQSFTLFGEKFNVGLFATIGGTADLTFITNPYRG